MSCVRFLDLRLNGVQGCMFDVSGLLMISGLDFRFDFSGLQITLMNSNTLPVSCEVAVQSTVAQMGLRYILLSFLKYLSSYFTTKILMLSFLA